MRRTELAGVPVLCSATSGTTHAGLAFRVGTADEPLARRGITRLVQRLALPPGRGAGSTGSRHTQFTVEGTPAEIVTFFHEVCASLRALPLERLADERRAAAPPGSPLARRRYGARGYGASSYPEWGLPTLTPAELDAWVAHYFTAGNAVLWIAADEPPPGLHLDLPAGAHRPLPTPASPTVRPASFTTDAPGDLAWDATVPRSTAALLFASFLERALTRALRQEDVLAESVSTDYEPLSAELALVSARATALPGQEQAVVGALVDVLAGLRFGAVDPDELAAVAERGAEAMQRADREAGRLRGQALNLLTGRDPQQTDDAVRELRAVSAAGIAEVAAAAWSDGLFLLPAGTCADWAGLAAEGSGSGASVAGTEFPSAADPADRLIAGPEGLTRLAPDGTRTTVRFDACEALLRWPDGVRELIGTDARTIRLDPSRYPGSARVLPQVDSGVPADRHIPLGEPPAPAPPADPLPTPHAPRLVLVIVAALVCLTAAAILFGAMLDGRDTGLPAALCATAALACTLAAAIAAIRFRGRQRRARVRLP